MRRSVLLSDCSWAGRRRWVVNNFNPTNSRNENNKVKDISNLVRFLDEIGAMGSPADAAARTAAARTAAAAGAASKAKP